MSFFAVKSDVLGINQRNANYIQRYNPRRLYPLVDDKLETKRLALAAGIAVPELYASIASQSERGKLQEVISQYNDFVIKPAHGSGGDGVMVITGRASGQCRAHDGRLLSLEDMHYHVSNILSGQYSLAGLPDKAMLEYRVRFDPIFETIAYQGVPDIRIIVFCGYPVMAMARLPTQLSAGKANLHQGAIGVGIDMGSGITLGGVSGNRFMKTHPDTGQPITNVAIPDWETLLALAASCYELSGLGYLGVDIVLDRERGPLILELNARPGLNIQIANGTGLVARLKKVPVKKVSDDVQERVAFSRKHYTSCKLER